MIYRIYRGSDKAAFFVETESVNLIKAIYQEEAKRGYIVVIKELHKTRWYKIDINKLNSIK